MSQDVDVSVPGAQLVIDVVQTVPAIEKFFHHVIAIAQGEASRIAKRVHSPRTLDIHSFTLTSSRYHFEQTRRKQVIKNTGEP